VARYQNSLAQGDVELVSNPNSNPNPLNLSPPVVGDNPLTRRIKKDSPTSTYTNSVSTMNPLNRKIGEHKYSGVTSNDYSDLPSDGEGEYKNEGEPGSASGKRSG
jgi:hypothetical protein